MCPLAPSLDEIGSLDDEDVPGFAEQPGERDLWRALQRNDHDAKAELVNRYLGLVRLQAIGIYRNTNTAYVDFRDLVQLGVIGLLEAMQNYDPDGTAAFKTYALKRIRGAMLDGLEQVSELHAQSIFRKRVREERARSIQESVRAGGGAEAFAQMVEIALGLAIGHMIEGTSMYASSVEEARPEENPGELHSLLVSMRALVDKLTEPGRQIIRRHYFDGLQFSAIAELLGLSKGRISQLHARAISELRESYRGRACVSLEI